MKISKETGEVLKNFSQINNGLVVEEPTCLKTISDRGNIIAVYDTEETFPVFAIWNLTTFNSLVDVLKIDDSEFDFQEDYVTIKSNSGSSMSYEYADAGAMPVFDQLKDSSKYKGFDSFDFSFEITEENIKEIKRASSILGLSEEVLKITLEDGKGNIKIYSELEETNTKYNVEISGDGSGEVCLKVDDLIIVSDDYNASVSVQNGIVKFQNKEKPLFYFIQSHIPIDER